MNKTNIQEWFAQYIKELNGMSLNGKDLYQQYFMLKSANSILNERIDELNNMIVEEMTTNGEKKKVFDYGGFTLASRTSYKFTDAVKEAKKGVKSLEEKEIEDGLAEKTESTYLLFK